jgi:integrase
LAGKCIFIFLIVAFFNIFRPAGGKCDALYLRPLTHRAASSWYADAPVGVHYLQKTVSKLCEQAGFKGHFTNHSLRATAATRLYDAGVDEQLIAEKGHRSSAIRSYKRTQNAQLEKCSEIIEGREHTEDDKENTKKRICEEISEP